MTSRADQDRLLARIDDLLGVVDASALDVHLRNGTTDASESYEYLCGGLREAVTRLYALVDHDGAPRREDV